MSEVISPWVAFDGVDIAFDKGAPVFRELSFGVTTESAVVAFVGPSGVGKTTLLGVIGGWIRPTRGSVQVLGRPVTRPEPDRAVVFQSHNLLPWKTVRGNVEFALPRGARRERRATVDALLARLGIAEVAESRPDVLSGGMAQRVGIARALAARPRVLLLDEPFSALDFLNREQMLDVLRCEVASRGTRIVLVTHDLDMALRLTPEIHVVAGGAVSRVQLPEHLASAAAAEPFSPAFLEVLAKVRCAVSDAGSPHQAGGVEPPADTFARVIQRLIKRRRKGATWATYY